MKCEACGNTVENNEKCSVCGFVAYEMPEGAPAFMADAMKKEAAAVRSKYIGNKSIELLSYYWENVDGELKEKSRHNVTICDNLVETELDTAKWSEVVYASQTAGEEKEITIVINANGDLKTITTKIIAPETSGLWKVGFVRRPNFQFALRIGDEKNYTDTQEFSLV